MGQSEEQQISHQGNSGSMDELMKGKSLLIVDDEQVILYSLSKELQRAGFTVTTAASGEEAIDRINNGFFHLVTTDLNMPGLDGFQVLKAAKNKNIHSSVIILTGYGSMDSIVDALRMGADDFLQKPCDTDELLFRISNCLRKQALQEKIALFEKFLPVCCYCKKIRDDRSEGNGQARWYALEEYFSKTKGVHVSHGCCPDCFANQMKNACLGES